MTPQRRRAALLTAIMFGTAAAAAPVPLDSVPINTVSLDSTPPDHAATMRPRRTTIAEIAPGASLTDISLEPPAGQIITEAAVHYTTPAGKPATAILDQGWSNTMGWSARITVRDAGPVEIRAALASGDTYRATLRADTEPRLFDTPAWAMGRVWYQVFPERFRNANAANDPEGPHTTTLPWTSDWWDVTDDEVERAWMRAAGWPRLFGYRPSNTAGAFGAVIYARRYGGDLQGVVEQLDHMRAIGVDALYLCPVFQSRSLHKYDTADFRHVDESLGNAGKPAPIYQHNPQETDDPATWQWTQADRYLIDVLLPEAKKRGMKVVLDGVWNHVGLDHFAFADVLQNGRESAYSDWFAVEFDNTGRVESWQAWEGRNGNLPEFKQTPDGDLAPGPKAHVMAVTSRWMDPNGDGDPGDGIDGWRLDVAAEIGRPFWRDWRAHVKAINPEALIIAELWHDGSDYYDGTAFDGQMHYPFAYAVTAWLGREPGYSTERVARELNALQTAQPQVDLVQYTLLASHDTERLGSMLDNPGRAYDQQAGTDAVLSGAYRKGPVSARGRRLSVLGAAIQAMSPGSPMIYGGDELGLAGPDDPHNRQPIIWPDLADRVDPARRPSASVLEGYRAWMMLREHPIAGPVLRHGAARFSRIGGDGLLIERVLDGVRVFTLINRTDSPIKTPDWVISGGAEPLLGAGGPTPGLSAAAWLRR